MARKIITVAAAVAVVGASLFIEPFAAPARAQDFMGVDFSCDSAESDLSSAIENSKPPRSEGVIVELQNLMWILKEVTQWLDSNCRSEDGYSETRASLNNSYNAALNACRGMSSTGACYASRYR